MGPNTIAEFYRAEAARCRDRAEKASTPERATRWRRVAEDSLRAAAELEAADDSLISQRHHNPVGHQAFVPSSRAEPTRGGRQGAGAAEAESHLGATRNRGSARRCGFELLAK